MQVPCCELTLTHIGIYDKTYWCLSPWGLSFPVPSAGSIVSAFTSSPIGNVVQSTCHYNYQTLFKIVKKYITLDLLVQQVQHSASFLLQTQPPLLRLKVCSCKQEEKKYCSLTNKWICRHYDYQPFTHNNSPSLYSFEKQQARGRGEVCARAWTSEVFFFNRFFSFVLTRKP